MKSTVIIFYPAGLDLTIVSYLYEYHPKINSKNYPAILRIFFKYSLITPGYSPDNSRIIILKAISKPYQSHIEAILVTNIII